MTLVAVLDDGTWAPLAQVTVYRLKDDKVLSFADNLDEILGDENPDAPIQNVAAVVCGVQLEELVDEYIDRAPDAVAPCQADSDGFELPAQPPGPLGAPPDRAGHSAPDD